MSSLARESLTNYPREATSANFSVYGPDLVVGLFGLASLFANVSHDLPALLGPIEEALPLPKVVVRIALCAIVVAFQSFLIARRRKGMWGLLALIGISIALAKPDELPIPELFWIQMLTLGAQLVTFLYLLARLSLRFGPRPR